MGDSLDNLALIKLEQKKLDEAESSARRTLAIREKMEGKQHSTVADSLVTLARVLAAKGKGEEAVATAQRTLAINKSPAARLTAPRPMRSTRVGAGPAIPRPSSRSGKTGPGSSGHPREEPSRGPS